MTTEQRVIKEFAGVIVNILKDFRSQAHRKKRKQAVSTEAYFYDGVANGFDGSVNVVKNTLAKFEKILQQ